MSEKAILKIAFLTPEFPHARTGYSGGIGSSIKNLAQILTERGNVVRVLVYGQEIDSVFNDGNIIVQQIKNKKFKGLSWYFTRKKIEKIINELKENNDIDLIEVPEWTGITSFVRPKSCPVVIKLHGSDTYFCHLDGRKVKWINRFHEKRALNKADAHISVSRFTALETNKLFAQEINYTIIPNGVNLKNFAINKEIKSDLRILYFGTVIRKKGLLELPVIFNEVIRVLPEAKLTIVGSDSFDIETGSFSTWQLMKELFSKRALKNVEYLGRVAYEEIPSVIESADVCVFPSFAEALPVSWLESMALGKAIVASNIGWASEIIDDGKEGYLRNPKAHLDYAAAIIDLLTDGQLRGNFGRMARKKVEKDFSQVLIAEITEEKYIKVCKDYYLNKYDNNLP